MIQKKMNTRKQIAIFLNLLTKYMYEDIRIFLIVILLRS